MSCVSRGDGEELCLIKYAALNTYDLLVSRLIQLIPPLRVDTGIKTKRCKTVRRRANLFSSRTPVIGLPCPYKERYGQVSQLAKNTKGLTKSAEFNAVSRDRTYSRTPPMICPDKGKSYWQSYRQSETLR